MLWCATFNGNVRLEVAAQLSCGALLLCGHAEVVAWKRIKGCIGDHRIQHKEYAQDPWQRRLNKALSSQRSCAEQRDEGGKGNDGHETKGRHNVKEEHVLEAVKTDACQGCADARNADADGERERCYELLDLKWQGNLVDAVDARCDHVEPEDDLNMRPKQAPDDAQLRDKLL